MFVEELAIETNQNIVNSRPCDLQVSAGTKFVVKLHRNCISAVLNTDLFRLFGDGPVFHHFLRKRY